MRSRNELLQPARLVSAVSMRLCRRLTNLRYSSACCASPALKSFVRSGIPYAEHGAAEDVQRTVTLDLAAATLVTGDVTGGAVHFERVPHERGA